MILTNNVKRVTLGTMIIVSCLVFISSTLASALSGADFQAGRITDDGVFFNAGSLTTSDIQAFLSAKVPVCDTNGTQPYGGTTRAAYGTSKGYPPPYICLKDYRQDTPAKAAEVGLCNGIVAGSNKSAAQIIFEVAQSCSVSPRALIVLLQKEQALVTDDWPWSSQYRSATGYGCPDTAACDSAYYGFFNQVYSAARQFKNYARVPSSFNYIAGRNNYIQYNPNASCGGSTVFIQNQATAGLYNYTPYQPNASALNNLYGTGDGCGAYGNRNYWRLYNDWFGSTFSPEYAWDVVSQQYTNNTADIVAGSTTQVTLVARNTGLQTWYRDGANATHLATSNPNDRASGFNDSSWFGYNRPAILQEASVAPGQTGTFTFIAKAPASPGQYREYVNLVAEGRAWFAGPAVNFYFNVLPRVFSWQVESQSYSPSTAYPLAGSESVLTLKAKNTGNVTWKNSGPGVVNLGTINETLSQYYHPTWIGKTRPAALQEASVAPGQTGTFTFRINVPKNPGEYREYFNLVSENVAWMQNPNMNFYLGVQARNYSWRIVSQQYSPNTVNVKAGTTAQITLIAQNTGNVAWSNTGPYPILLGTSNLQDRTSIFQNSSWIGYNRPTILQEPSVAPGSNGTFTFTVKAPQATGQYREYFNLVAENFTWMPNPNMNFFFNVTP